MMNIIKHNIIYLLIDMDQIEDFYEFKLVHFTNNSHKDILVNQVTFNIGSDPNQN